MADFDESKKYQEQEETFVSALDVGAARPAILTPPSSMMAERLSSCTLSMANQISMRSGTTR